MKIHIFDTLQTSTKPMNNKQIFCNFQANIHDEIHNFEAMKKAQNKLSSFEHFMMLCVRWNYLAEMTKVFLSK